MLPLLSKYRKEIILTTGSLLTGFFIGGLLWGSSTETKTVYDFIETEKEVVVEKVVEVIKTVEVIKKEYITADKAIIKETKQADGTILIESEYYNLGVAKHSSEVSKEVSKESYKEETKESTKQEHSTSIMQAHRNRLSISYFSSYDVTQFDYKADWVVSYERHLLTTPFYGKVFIGPKMFGLGIGFSF